MLHVAVSSPSTFKFEELDLRQGMGEDFDSPLYDAMANQTLTTKRMNKARKEDGIEVANAYARLRYVALVLKVLRERSGSFPHKFDADGESHVSTANEVSLVPKLIDSNVTDVTSDLRFEQYIIHSFC